MAANDYEVLSWDSMVNEESEFPDLPDGDYDFTVLNVERAMHDGSSAGIPVECPKFIIQYRVSNGEVSGPIRDTFYLLKKWEWKLSAFLLAIGQKNHDEPVSLQKIASAAGATGRCKIGKSKDGKYTNIQKYYPLKPTTMQGFTPVNNASSPFAQPAASGWGQR